jgi:phage FluMu protein Com
MAPKPNRTQSFEGTRPRIQIISNEVRCDCGALLCKLVTGDTIGIEIKCGRCKQFDFIPCEIDSTAITKKQSQQDRDEELEERCECNKLLGKFIGNRLEVKCKRCKALVLLPCIFSQHYLDRKR